MSDIETHRDWKNEPSYLAVKAVSEPGHIMAETAQSATDEMIQQVDATAREFDAAGRDFANDAEKARSLLSLGSNSLGNFNDLHQSFAGLVEGVIRTNLRLAQELLIVESPRAFVELQQRFMREYFEAFQKGAAALIRAAGQEKASPSSP